MEVSALKYTGGVGLHGRSPLLRLQSDERLISLTRRGNQGAFEVLVGRYESRLLAFCRHLLGSREDAEDVLQEVMTAAFNAILADERAINVRPWLYRIARNRSLNHLRRTQAIGVDSMDHHLADHGATVADKVHEREEFRILVGDIQELPETQKTALVLREMDALSYEQIAEAMESTVSSVKSLLVRARVSLAEAAEARLLSCEEVRTELAEVAEGLLKKPNPLVRRHLKDCKRCTVFRQQLKQTNKALAALLPVGPLVVFKKFALLHFGSSAGAAGAHSGAAAGTGATAAAGSTATAAGGAAIASSSVFAGGGGGLVSAGIGAVGVKAAAGIAAAAIVTAGAVEVDQHKVHHVVPRPPVPVAVVTHAASVVSTPVAPTQSYTERRSTIVEPVRRSHRATKIVALKTPTTTQTTTTTTTAPTSKTTTTVHGTTVHRTPVAEPPPGRTLTTTDPTVLPTPTPTLPTDPVTPAPVTPEPITSQPITSQPTPTGPTTTAPTTTGTTITTTPTSTTVTTTTPTSTTITTTQSTGSTTSTTLSTPSTTQTSSGSAGASFARWLRRLRP